MTVPKIYTYQDVQYISCDLYSLPESVLSTIKNLENEIQQIIQNTPIDERPVKKHYDKSINIREGFNSDRRRSNTKHIGGGFVKQMATPTDENWNTGKTIKITPKLVNEESDKIINEIRTALNKLSPKNIESQRDVIIQNIKSVLETDAESVEKIAKLIFDIASSNKFMSELYAQLYKDLTEVFDMFKSRLENLFETYKTSLNDIIYINPNDDYNGYCKYTKTNDARKALTAFIVNLMKHGVLEAELVFDMTKHMIDTVFRCAAEENRTNEVEEITENLFILMSQSDAELNHYEIWTDEIIPKINELSKLRKTEGAKYPSMTNRATFKYMDILDNLN